MHRKLPRPRSTGMPAMSEAFERSAAHYQPLQMSGGRPHPPYKARAWLVDVTPVEVFNELRKQRDKFQNMPH
jgi:hypothetical protein